MWNRAINTTSLGIGQVCVHLEENADGRASHGTNLEAELHVWAGPLSWKVSFRRIAKYYLSSLHFEWITRWRNISNEAENNSMKISIRESLIRKWWEMKAKF